MGQRPVIITANASHPYADNLVVGLFGNQPFGAGVVDSSTMQRAQGLITNTTPGALWKLDPFLYRPVMVFDGTDDYVQFPMGADLNGTALSVLAWVKWSASANVWPRIIDRNYAGSFAMYVTESNSCLGAAVRGVTYPIDTAGVSSASSVPAGVWTHVALTFDGNQIVSYINGSYNQTTSAIDTGLLQASAEDFRIGQRLDGSNRAFEGEISDVAVYNGIIPSSLAADFADPANTMLSGLLMAPERIWWSGINLPAGSGAMSGSGALTVTSSATARGTGALAGSSALAVTSSGTLTPPTGAMSGSSALSITSSATARGTGLLAGSVSMVLSSSLTNALISGGGARYTVADHRPRYTVADHRPRYTISEAT